MIINQNLFVQIILFLFPLNLKFPFKLESSYVVLLTLITSSKLNTRSNKISTFILELSYSL